MKIVVFGFDVSTKMHIDNYLFNPTVKIVAFLDNNKEKDSTHDGIPVYLPHYILKLDYDYIVIMSLNNYQEMIEQLISYGISRDKIIISLERAHNEYFQDTGEDVRSAIFLQKGKFPQIKIKHDILSEAIQVRVPIELIRVVPQDNIYLDSSDKKNFKECNICRLQSYIELFEFLAGQSKQYPTEYLKQQTRGNEYNEMRTLEFRKYFYLEREEWLKKGYEYYCSQSEPLMVKYSKESRTFSLLDGAHRCIFLLLKRFRYIDVKMGIADYQAFMNKNELLPTIKKVDELQCDMIMSPILHPLFKEYKFRDNGLYPTFAENLLAYLYDSELKGKDLLIFSSDDGYTARMFAREGMEVTVFGEKKERIPLAVQIGKLENIFVSYCPLELNNLHFDKKFKYCIISKEFVDVVGDSERILHLIDNHVVERILIPANFEASKLMQMIISKTKFHQHNGAHNIQGKVSIIEFCV